MSRSRISNVEDYLDNEIVFYMPRIDLKNFKFFTKYDQKSKKIKKL